MKLMRNSGFSWETLSPGKRLVLFITSLAVVLIAILVTIPMGSREKKGLAANPPKTKGEILQDLNRDSDQDGLKDWEEKIYGTDPNNPDTDGDGAPDGEEIKGGRNPLKPGPDDKLSIPLPSVENENKTQEIANELISKSLTQIIARAAAGQSLNKVLSNTTELNAYINSLVAEKDLDKVKRPESNEFVTSPDNSPEAVKKYFNAVAQIYLSNFEDIESDVSVLARFSRSGGDVKVFRELDANVAAIEKAIKEIKKTPTPHKWLGFAKDDVWYLSKTLAAVKILRNSENDPAASLLILKDRMDLLDAFGALYSDTKLKLAAAGITFSPAEPAGQIIIRQ
ncbi:MAG: hypothetical protein WAP51_04885 [Candidatus Sungiibacteriota bacterium]